MLGFNKSTLLRNSAFLNKRAKDIFEKIHPYLQEGDRIIDIGCGGGHVAKIFKNFGYNVVPIDIKNKSYFEDIQPIIYDGNEIPFNNNEFDVSFLINVLHHTKDPIAVLSEAKRVSKRIIVIEDLYKGFLQKYFTFAMDSILNREFFGHPHSNRTEEEWKSTFRKLGLEIVDEKKNNFWIFFTSGLFYLQKKHRSQHFISYASLT